MTAQDWLLLCVYTSVLAVLAWPLSRAIDAVMSGRFALGQHVETPLFRLAGIDPEAEQGWLRYALGLLVFNGLGVLAVYALQRLQGLLPLNPQDMPGVAPASAFNTAISFVSNTNWQGYGGETTMSYLTQMLGLTVQNFLSAASGIAVAIALVRGFARHSARTIGNVWVDLTRIVLWILLPLSLLFALALAGQGVIQTLSGYPTVHTLQPQQSWRLAADARVGHTQPAAAPGTQTLAMGPVASQEAIKMLGTNGGGFFNANSAHPFENPTPLSNFMQMLAILLIPAALVFTFGRMVGDRRQGMAVFTAMFALLAVCAVAAMTFEQQGNPQLATLGVDQSAGPLQGGGNMEGKEVRFGSGASALFATLTTAASNGAVDAMHDSFTPLGGAVTLTLIDLGEVVFGGVGSGLYGMLLFAAMAVFIAGATLVSAYSARRDVRMTPGSTARLAGYTFEFDGVHRVRGPDYVARQGVLRLRRAGREVATLRPEKRTYRAQPNAMTEAAIAPGLFRDLYVALGNPQTGNAWAVRLQYKPFQRWIWLGGILMFLGGLLAATDRRYRLARRSEGVSPTVGTLVTKG